MRTCLILCLLLVGCKAETRDLPRTWQLAETDESRRPIVLPGVITDLTAGMGALVPAPAPQAPTAIVPPAARASGEWRIVRIVTLYSWESGVDADSGTCGVAAKAPAGSMKSQITGLSGMSGSGYGGVGVAIVHTVRTMVKPAHVKTVGGTAASQKAIMNRKN
jgi:hypothetical protein